MARIRTIKPDAFQSDSLSSVPRGARWTFAGLWTYLDDEGRGRADPRLIHADLYPIDDSTTVHDVASDLDALEEIGAVCRYETAGKTYIHAPKWHHQKINRPTPSRLPPCPKCDDSLNAHGGLTEETMLEQGKGTGKGNREREQGSARETRDDSVIHPDPFNEFIEVWPGNIQVKRAFAYWPAAVKAARGAEIILTAARAYADWIRRSGTEPRYVRSAANWLRDEGWRDELKTAQRTTGPASNIESHVALVNQLAARESGTQPPPRQIGAGS